MKKKYIKFRVLQKNEIPAGQFFDVLYCIDDIIFANEDLKQINFDEYIWMYPPVYAEILLNKALSKHGFYVQVFEHGIDWNLK